MLQKCVQMRPQANPLLRTSLFSTIFLQIPQQVAKTKLKPVLFDVLSLGYSLLLQPFRDLIALVARKLEHLTKLLVVDDSAVACKLLFEGTQHFLKFELARNTLNGRQGLAAVALLDADIWGEGERVKDNKGIPVGKCDGQSKVNEIRLLVIRLLNHQNITISSKRGQISVTMTIICTSTASGGPRRIS